MQASPIQEISTPIIEFIRESGLFQDAIAQAVADRVLETAEEMAAEAKDIINEIDFTNDILEAFLQGGFNEAFQGRLDALGALGEVVSLRIQLALIVHADELKKLQDEPNKTLLVEIQTKEEAIQSEYQIKRNALLTKMFWILNIFSLWPVVLFVAIFTTAGFVGGVVYCRNTNHAQIVH